jgi:hypothetical protein
MIGTRPERLNFTPALACMDCKRQTTQGLIYRMSALVWQLLPLCDEHIGAPTSDEPMSLGALRCRINKQLTVIQQLQQRKRHMGRAYVRLRRAHTPMALRRALRRQLNQAYKLQAEGMEVVS